MLDGFEAFLQSNTTTEYLSSSSSSMSESGELGKKKKQGKNKNNNKRRFSDDQIRSLEVIFESETKLEPARKAQIAKELGLHQRQVAIWFQNRRARWKSKHLQKEYSILHNNYTCLSSQFEAIKREKQSLLLQIQELNDELQRLEPDRLVKEEKRRDLHLPPLVRDDHHDLGFPCKDDENRSSIMEAYFGLQDEDHKLSVVVVDEQQADDSLASNSNNWESLEFEFGSSCQWWDVWS